MGVTIPNMPNSVGDEPREGRSATRTSATRRRRGKGASIRRDGADGAPGEATSTSSRRGALKALVISVVGLSVVMALVSAAGERGIRRVHRFSAEVARIDVLNDELDAENKRLSREIEALRNDPAAAEAVARDELGLVRPGERVFRFEGGER